MKKHKDTLAGFGIEAAIQHALTLNEEADNADMIILECGNSAWLCVLQMITYMVFRPGVRGFVNDRPEQYPGATGYIFTHGAPVLVVPDESKGDKVYVIHDKDNQWSVSTTVDSS